MITVAMFRCFEGDVSQEEIGTILAAVQDKSILLKKDSSNKSAKVTMEDSAKRIKTSKKLKEIIIAFYQENHTDDFPPACSWEDVHDRIPALEDHVNFRKCRRAAGEVFLTNLLKRNVTCKACPPSLALRLEDLYCRQFGKTRARVEPYMCFFSDNLLKIVKPEIKDRPTRECPLAIVDFSRKDQRQWTDSEIFFLFEHIVECGGKTVVVAISILPSPLFSNILVGLHSFS
ncbi:unnamed protein product [Calypogeia fissa]